MNKARHTLVVALACAACALTACGDNRSADERVSDAYADIEQARFRDAVIELRNVLRADPQNARARVGLGIALLETGDADGALKELRRAKDLGAAPDAYADALALALQERNAHVELLAEIDADAVADPALASLLHTRRGRSMAALGSVAAAEAVFDEQLAAGQSVEAQRIALMGKASLAADRSDLATAERLLERSLEIAPDSAQSVLALGGLYISQSRFDEVISALSAARERGVAFTAKEQFLAVALHTEALLGLQDNEAARATAARLRKLSKDHPMSAYLSGRAELQSGNTDEAVRYLQELLSRHPGFDRGQTLMGAALIQRGDLEEAQMHLANVVGDNAKNVSARQLLAETQLRMKRPEAAMQTLREGLRHHPNQPQLIALLGRATLQLGQSDAGIDFLRNALRREPDNVQAKLALVAAYIARDEGAQAIEVLDTVPAGAIDERRRRVLVASAGLDRDDVAAVESRTKSLLEDFPDDPFVISVAGGFYASAGLLDKARTQYERLLALQPDSHAARLNILRVDEREGDLTRSRAIFEAAHQQDRSNIETMLILIRIYQLEGEPDRALAMARRAYEADATALSPNLLLANEAMRQQDFAAVEQFAAAAVAHHPDSGQAHALMGMLQARSDASRASIESFRRAVQASPETYVFHHQLARALHESGQTAEAIESYANVLALKPDHVPSMRALVLLSARAGDMQRAETLIRDARARLGADSAVVLDIIGEVYAIGGMLDEALQALAKVQQSAPNFERAVKMYELGYRNGDPDATRPLQAWVDRAPEDAAARLILAQAYQRVNRSGEAIREYEAVLGLEPEAVMALNNVAWLYLEKGGPQDLDRAHDRAARAYQIMPDNADVADTYGWISFRKNEVARALGVLRKAMGTTTAQASPDIAYHLAAVLHATGKPSDARKLLSEALSSTGPFMSRAEARQLLESL